MPKLKVGLHCYFSNLLDVLSSGESVRNWRRFKSKTRNLDAFYNKKLGLVIKKPVFILEHRTPVKFRVPTYQLKNDYIIQPLVSRKNLGSAVRKLRNQLKPYLKRGIFPDLHTGNVGWYKNKPLMFDW
jgi:hypothetical protein